MATRPTIYPRWAETAAGSAAANIVEPPSGNKDTGWTTGQVPPSSWENWKAQSVYDWVKYLDTVGNLISSPWKSRATPGSTSWTAMCFAATQGEAGRLVVASNAHYQWSDDLGLTWTTGSATSGTYADAIDFDPDTSGGLWVAVGDNNHIDTSTDGKTWTSRTGPSVGNDLHTVTHAPGGGLFLCGISNGKVGTSPTGVTWTERTTGLASGITGVVYNTNLVTGAVAMTAGGGTTTSIATSNAAGTAWTTRTSPSGMRPNPGAATFGGACLFFGVSTTADKTVYTSPDGITWTLRFTSPTSTYTGLIGGLYYKNWFFDGRTAVIFPVGTLGPPIYSIDGVTWKQGPAPVPVAPNTLCSTYSGAAAAVDSSGLSYTSILPSLF